jgi:hypothetical protein
MTEKKINNSGGEKKTKKKGEENQKERGEKFFQNLGEKRVRNYEIKLLTYALSHSRTYV